MRGVSFTALGELMDHTYEEIRQAAIVNECTRIVRALIFECFWLSVSC